MTTARHRQIRLEVTPYYHCTTRCVRKSYLCGKDYEAGRNFDHRKGWIEERLITLSQAFCIDVAAYSIMSNHYHVTLVVNKEEADSLSDIEVVQRRLQIFKGCAAARKFLDHQPLSEDESRFLTQKIKQWRFELASISKFMSQINEKIARWANKEDDCKGRFWEARFDSQAVLDLDALLRTMVYDDLNPVRAKTSSTPEESEYTSVHRRLHNADHGLIPFKLKSDSSIPNNQFRLPVSLDEYLELLDWTGRQIQQNKRGAIANDMPPILDRLSYSPDQWMKIMRRSTTWTQKAIGSAARIKQYCEAIGQRWIWQTSD